MKRGNIFVELEGIDGCGKTTQAKLVAEKIAGVSFKFPDYSTNYGKLIYSYLIEPEPRNFLGPMQWQALMTVNKVEKQSFIADILTKSSLVVDRYMGSAYCYGGCDGVADEDITAIHATCIKPDLSILLDVDVDDSFKRRPKRESFYENDKQRLNNIAGNYRDFWNAKEHPYNAKFVVINGRHPVEVVTQLIINEIRKYQGEE